MRPFQKFPGENLAPEIATTILDASGANAPTAVPSEAYESMMYAFSD